MSVYLYANIKLKYGQGPAFNETMAKLKPMFEKRGWKLVGAWSTVIGDLNEVHDIWELEDANAVGAAMSSAFEDPEFMAVAPELADQIATEVITVVTKTPYSP
jgi:hypothetical protein